MLKDEVKFLHELANVLIVKINTGHLQTPDHLKDTKDNILVECQRVKKTWSDLLFSQTKDYVIKRYVWFQQQSLLDLIDTLHDRIKQDEKSGSQSGNESVLIPLSFLIEQLLVLNHFLIQFFNSYVNQDIKIPSVSIPDVRKKMTESAEQLSASLQTVKLDTQLKAIILDYLQSVISLENSSPITYRSLAYLIQFTESLSVTIAFEYNRDLTFSVTETLFYMNFNHNGFCQWYKENLTRGKKLLKPFDQLPMLKKQLLALKTMPVIITTSYDPGLLPVNTLLGNWLNEYIKEELDHHDPSKMDISQKIELRLTVAQLALLIRLLYEEGVFAMKNIASLLRFFSGHFMSKKQEHISYGSMNKLYYSGDQFTGYAVRELLLKMVAKINKMFFPT